MISYDADQLRSLADRAHRKARFIAFVYAFVAFAIGAPIGASLVIVYNGGRRIEVVRSRTDYDDLIAAPKREELKWLLHRTPQGAFAVGLALGVCGLFFGLARASSLRLEAQTALCMAQIESKLSGRGGS
jgi:hypothetical protein